MSQQNNQQRRGTVAICQDIHTVNKDGMESIEKKWQGVFIGSSSNPINFGPELWEILQNNWRRLDKFADELFHCGYWAEYRDGGLCPFCGKFGVGYPSFVNGNLFKLYQDNGPHSMAPDPEARGHTHIPPCPSIESKNAEDDGLWIEWAYIVDPKTYSLEILKAVRAKGFHISKKQGKKWHQENYQYISTSHCCLFNDEPNWEVIERRGINMSKYYFDKTNEGIIITDFGVRRPRG